MLNNLYTSIYNYQNRPVNPLYAHLPTTINVEMQDVSFSMVLPPKSSKVDEDWVHWTEVEEVDSDSESDNSEDRDWPGRSGQYPATGGRKGAIDVQPWQTLLLLEDNAAENAEQLSQLLVGLGVRSGNPDATPSSTTTAAADASRRASGDTMNEDDDGALMKCLIQACDVTKP